jgi:hypothetical protein
VAPVALVVLVVAQLVGPVVVAAVVAVVASFNSRNRLARLSTTAAGVVEMAIAIPGRTVPVQTHHAVLAVVAARLARLARLGAIAAHRFTHPIRMRHTNGPGALVVLVVLLVHQAQATAVQPAQQVLTATQSPAIQTSPTRKPERLQEQFRDHQIQNRQHVSR